MIIRFYYTNKEQKSVVFELVQGEYVMDVMQGFDNINLQPKLKHAKMQLTSIVMQYAQSRPLLEQEQQEPVAIVPVAVVPASPNASWRKKKTPIVADDAASKVSSFRSKRKDNYAPIAEQELQTMQLQFVQYEILNKLQYQVLESTKLYAEHDLLSTGLEYVLQYV